MGKIKEREIAAKLFGKVRKIVATGNHQPDAENVSMALEGEDAIIQTFCMGCGMMFELNENGARDLAKIAEIELPDDATGKFFQTGCCPYCDSVDTQVLLRDKVELMGKLSPSTPSTR
jgi:hypothetical protein